MDTAQSDTRSGAQSDSNEALEQFKQRMEELRLELRAINRELGVPDLLLLAHRTRELLRRTRGLLDGNVTVLFAKKPPRVYENLYDHVHYAEGHVVKALAEEYEFEAIKERLFMATALAEYIINGVSEAIRDVEAMYAAGDF
jgi:hypothetical protein